MPRIIAILFEEKKEESYIAIQLDGEDPLVLFSKGPGFTKTMGPFPVPYAEATFGKWDYCKVENPPYVNFGDKKSLIEAIHFIKRQHGNTARYSPDKTKDEVQ
jgi:hypothetical protein